VESERLVLRPTIDREWLERVARDDPFSHAYARWDLDRFPDRLRFVSAVGPDGTLGYLLVWLGHPRASIVHWFGGVEVAPILADALPPRPLVVVAPPEVVDAIEGARGRAPHHVLELLVADREVDRAPRSPVVRPLAGADRNLLFAWSRGRDDPAVAEYPYLDPAVESVWGCFEGDELIGVVRAEVRLPEVWLVGGVYVDPRARGRGVGLALVRAATVAGHGAGAEVGLYVREDRPRARSVYARAGFRPRGRRVWIDAGSGLEP
jgi:ribosomal protein S18 acetylase RimI-like enzyme